MELEVQILELRVTITSAWTLKNNKLSVFIKNRYF